MNKFREFSDFSAKATKDRLCRCADEVRCDMRKRIAELDGEIARWRDADHREFMAVVIRDERIAELEHRVGEMETESVEVDNANAEVEADYCRRIAELEAENERLREVLQEVEDWDLVWADGLDTNVERIKRLVREALRK